MITGRLKPGVSIEQAQHEMTRIAGELARRVPTSNKGWSASVEPLQNSFLSADRRTTLWLLLAAVGFVVLAATGGMLGILSGAWLLQGLLVAVFPRGTLPSEADPRLSVPVLLFGGRSCAKARRSPPAGSCWASSAPTRWAARCRVRSSLLAR
jgi:putative ABC transport system permease protein